MENKQVDNENEQISNPEQFQIGRSHQQPEELPGEVQEGSEKTPGYTEQETEFADGEGTRLNEEISSDRDNSASDDGSDEAQDLQPEVNDI